MEDGESAGRSKEFAKIPAGDGKRVRLGKPGSVYRHRLPLDEGENPHVVRRDLAVATRKHAVTPRARFSVATGVMSIAGRHAARSATPAGERPPPVNPRYPAGAQGEQGVPLARARTVERLATRVAHWNRHSFQCTTR